MALETWLLFCLTEVVLCLTPGPAVLYVLSQGMHSGFKASVAGASGIVFGNTFYFAISATGLGALILASHQVFFVIKLLGAAYLIWLGLAYIFNKSEELKADSKASINTHKIFRAGAVIQLSNPKNLVFFIAILPQFIDPNASIVLQILIIGVTSVVIEFLCLCLYGGLSSRAERWVKENNFSQVIDKLSGGLLVGIGTSLALVNVSDR